ncbi:type II toxin-antitoxin system VapC family toxin [Bifidobacterium tibiigranuli]|jgi:predicted nucleic acid-binding protein|uniref:type II toxin-antitoxin system VapC family toxin n=1 Tax=Bifidobacterium tibiigranuli TaxID=2172043 RepID=UPI0026F06F84|nr:type II toxin-antitoxin system VapC family toxin [Bifidobacterium tibiigranuli]MCI1714153.1 type II toxin-antitoxin system VapC family toxin [Bifidobacterium tibiigranuli]MCI1834138.1 type II toxin-antitoxin system VapC family toxin [Bifidobacterium tibiigranuli]
MTATGNESSQHYPKRAVVDTNVIVNVALGAEDTTDPVYLPRSKRLLNDGIAGELELLLPSMVMIELSCNHIVRSGKSGQSQSQERRHKKMLLEWCRNSNLTMVDLTADAAGWFSETIAVQNLRPGDAAVLASAKYAHATHVYTWDKGFIDTVEHTRGQGHTDIVACNPPELPPTQGELELVKD